jgi:hypothetical protein
MIALLISTIWLVALVLVVAVCTMAARGDRTVLEGAKHRLRVDALRSPRLLDGPALWGQTLSFKLEDRRGTKPSRVSSKSSTAKYVRDGSQEDLYVRP